MRPATFLILALTGISRIQGQKADEATRQLFAEEFLESRPAPPAAQSGNAARLRRNMSANPARSVPQNAVYQLGMTLWLLRPARASDSDVRILVHEDGQSTEWVPERISNETPLRQGDRVRLSFESARQGYLYVIDRELYEDDRLGVPYLIFPTRRIHNGDNYVTAGRVVEIPGQDDRPNFLMVRSTGKGLRGEQLSVIVTPEPLSEVKIGSQAALLNPEQLAIWQQNWGVKAEVFESPAESGKVWTKAEQRAGANETRLLTQEDPGPQTVYRVVTGRERPILVTVRLNYAPENSRR